MEIDIKHAKKEFIEYTKKYDINDEQIKLKIKHIQRVSNNSKIIAESLKLDEENVKLAELIGLLHDIGRFEQIKKYHTFKDLDSINHAELGIKILYEEGLIKKFLNTNKYDKIIKTAILNHNKTNIQTNISKEELIHSKIIRDADTLDIFSILISESPKIVWETENIEIEKISNEIYKNFIETQKMDYSKIKSGVDLLVCHFAYIFNFNYQKSIEIIKEKNYLNKLYKRFNFKDEKTQKQIDEIYNMCLVHIENALKKS